MTRRSRCLFVFLCFGCPLLVWIAFGYLNEILLARGVLNKKDLWAEGGTFWEYLTNAWNWYGVEMLLLLAIPLMALAGIVSLVRTRDMLQPSRGISTVASRRPLRR